MKSKRGCIRLSDMHPLFSIDQFRFISYCLILLYKYAFLTFAHNNYIINVFN